MRPFKCYKCFNKTEPRHEKSFCAVAELVERKTGDPMVASSIGERFQDYS